MVRNLLSFSLLTFLVITACKDEDPEIINDPNANKVPINENFRLVEGQIDEDFDFEGKKVFSLFDSTTITNGQFIINSLNGLTNPLFIYDAAGEGKILATIFVDEESQSVRVDKREIAKSLIDLAPVYSSLSDSMQHVVYDEVIANSTLFAEFEEVVESIVKDKGNLFSLNNEVDTFIIQIDQLVAQYTASSVKIERSPDKKIVEDFNDFIKKDERGQVYLVNPNASFSKVSFSPLLFTGTTYPYTLNPSDPFDFFKSRTYLTEITDGCYLMNISQTELEVLNNNASETVRMLLKTLLGKVITNISSSPDLPSNQLCMNNLYNSLIVSMTDYMASSDFISRSENREYQTILLDLCNKFTDDLLGMLTDENCLINSVAGPVLKQYLGDIVLKKLSLLTAVFQSPEDVRTILQYYDLFNSIFDPLEGSHDLTFINNFSFYSGRLGLKEAPIVNESVTPGENIVLSVQVLVNSAFSAVVLSDLTVNWDIYAGDHHLDRIQTFTDDDGNTSLLWTIPVDLSPGETIHFEANLINTNEEPINGVAGVTYEFKIEQVLSLKELLIQGSPWAANELCSDGSTDEWSFTFTDDVSGFETEGSDTDPFTYSISGNMLVLNFYEVEYIDSYEIVSYSENEIIIKQDECTATLTPVN